MTLILITTPPIARHGARGPETMLRWHDASTIRVVKLSVDFVAIIKTKRCLESAVRERIVKSPYN